MKLQERLVDSQAVKLNSALDVNAVPLGIGHAQEPIDQLLDRFIGDEDEFDFVARAGCLAVAQELVSGEGGFAFRFLEWLIKISKLF